MIAEHKTVEDYQGNSRMTSCSQIGWLCSTASCVVAKPPPEKLGVVHEPRINVSCKVKFVGRLGRI